MIENNVKRCIGYDRNPIQMRWLMGGLNEVDSDGSETADYSNTKCGMLSLWRLLEEMWLNILCD